MNASERAQTEAAVLQANHAFYRAFSRGDYVAMSEIWAKAAPVACLHPGAPLLAGRAAVLASWRHLLASAPSFEMVAREPRVALLSASSVPARKELVLKGADYYYMGQYGEIGTKMKVGVFVEFDNKEASKLGMPLPKGTLRVYKKDSKGNAQFVGEDNIDHTPKNETVRLKLGEAFDVTADKKQTDFKVLPRPSKGNNAYESAYELTLKNAKKEKVTVTVQEPIGGDWKIVSESAPHTKANSHLALWKIDIPAEGKTTLTYRAQVKY